MTWRRRRDRPTSYQVAWRLHDGSQGSKSFATSLSPTNATMRPPAPIESTRGRLTAPVDYLQGRKQAPGIGQGPGRLTQAAGKAVPVNQPVIFLSHRWFTVHPAPRKLTSHPPLQPSEAYARPIPAPER